jgi:aspartate beta-hydroxylase
MNNPIYDRAGDWLRGVYDRRVSTPAVLDPAQYFPSARRFTDSWRELREEALAIRADLSSVPRFHELMAAQADISANDQRDWRMLVVKAYGVPFEANAAKAPRLAQIVAQCPDVLTASLSFLAPYKHVPPHRGPFRGVIRYYLPLSVPPAEDGLPGSTLTIDGRDYRLGDGEALLWDDTFVHEVRNRANDVRIALLLDVRRRGLPRHLEWLTRVLIAGIRLTVRVRKPV